MNAEGFRARTYSSLSYMCYLNYANSPSYQSTEQLISVVYNNRQNTTGLTAVDICIHWVPDFHFDKTE